MTTTTATTTVRPGDTVSGLAERLNVDARDLMRANGMDPGLADGRVTLPAGFEARQVTIRVLDAPEGQVLGTRIYNVR